MATLHGSWLVNAQSSGFFLWGETWRNMASPTKTETSSDSAIDSFLPSHPFVLDQASLLAALQSQGLQLETLPGIWKPVAVALPSRKGTKSKPALPLLSGQCRELATDRKPQTWVLADWQIEGLWLTGQAAIAILAQLPISAWSDFEHSLGDDLRYWTHLYRWSLDLLVRSKFLPYLVQREDGKYQSQWYPLLDSIIDQTRFARFSQLFPAVCRYYRLIDLDKNGKQQQETDSDPILNFLRESLELQIQDWIGEIIPASKAPLVKDWLQGLSQDQPLPSDQQLLYSRLENALRNWTRSVQDYLVTPQNDHLGTNQYRVCLVLVPPTSGEVAWGILNWKLHYYLQALDDPAYRLEAATIWQNPLDELTWGDRTVENPQETLLKGLGIASRLYAPVAESLQSQQPTYCELNPIQVYEFIKATAWRLEDNGLGVVIPPSLIADQSEKRLGIKLEAAVQTAPKERLNLKSLLNYDLKLVIGEQILTKADFEKLLAQKSPLVEVNGEWIALQPADVRAAQAILVGNYEATQLTVEDALRMSTGEHPILAKLPVVQFEASGVLEELINNIAQNQGIEPIAQPPGFLGTLRPYQARGVAWLSFLEKWGLGACLADDMGLGKTPQLLGFMLHLKAQGLLTQPSLIVCPTSVINNWEHEVKKFAPSLSVLIHHGDRRKKGTDFQKSVKNKHLVITSYALIYRDLKTLSATPWQGIVLDEAQNIKNAQAKQSQAIRQLAADFRIALTGTPVENRLAELWSILEFLNPGFLGTQQFFQRRFATPIEKFGDRESLQVLRSLVRPFILRRLKTDRDIIQDLPEKQEMDVFCGLSAEQAQLYQTLVEQSLAEIEAATGIQRRGLILTLLLKLKQLCNHPAQLLKEKSISAGDRSGKLLRLEEMLEELVEEGDRALVFTQFAEWGKLLQPYLTQKLGREVLFLYGSTPREQRQAMVDRFQDDPNGPPIFILSLKAGGTGLNLTRANHVFHIDRWWNPAVENQASDRAFRIGQKRNVQVHKFICTGTLEEKINEMLESKKQLAEQTVDAGEQWLTELDTDQLRNLLILDRNAVIDDP